VLKSAQAHAYVVVVYFYLAYAAVTTPTGNTNDAPSGLKFGNYVFDFSAYLNDNKLHGVNFDPPITAIFTYDPSLLGNLVESTLTVAYWNGIAWSNDGVMIIVHDLAAHTLTVLITHLSEFAYFAADPTSIGEEPEPDSAAHIYLPVIGAYSNGLTPTVNDVAPPAPEIDSAAYQLYLPVTAH
jgi:hypothetical protein